MPRVIKRYANRKLYDQQASRYVSLDDLLALIRAGEDVQVLDAATGDDLTSVTLAQVILERERGSRGVGGLPAAFLHQVIRHGETWQDFVTTSMRTSLEGMLTTQRQADRFFRDWAARTGMLAGPPPAAEPEAPAPEPPAEAAEPGAEEPAEPAEPAPTDGGQDGGQVAELRRQMAALEARLRALEGD
jgi:polyhydroxyalkanoate synthesis repressor PhaR